MSKKARGSRTARRQGTKTFRALLKRRQYYRDCLDRRKDKTRAA